MFRSPHVSDPLLLPLQKELTKKVQRTDALQAELNTAVTAKTAAESRAAGLSSQLEQATKQLSIISSRDGELQTLAAELAAASSAKASLEAKVRPHPAGYESCAVQYMAMHYCTPQVQHDCHCLGCLNCKVTTGHDVLHRAP